MRWVLKSGGLTLALLLLLVVAGVLWPVPTAPLPDDRQDRLIVNARVIDVERGTTSAPTRVLIRRGIITDSSEALTAPGIPVLDARGGYLLPGFWDMHVHSFQRSLQSDLPLFVASGVTGVRDIMDCPDRTDPLIACVADKRRWSRDADAGRMASPRFVEVASFYFERPDTSPDETARLAAEYKARGLDALKVYNRVPRSTYLRLAAEAKRLDMRLVGHLPGTRGARVAAPGGPQRVLQRHARRHQAADRVPDQRLLRRLRLRVRPSAGRLGRMPQG